MGSSNRTLDEIGRSQNTDKASLFRDPRDSQTKTGNDYLRHYDRELTSLRAEPLLLVELGIGYGAEAGNSLRMWDEYFTHRHAQIVGVDIESVHKAMAGDRISIEIGDCGSVEFLEQLAAAYPSADVIVDDASHYWTHQVTAFNTLFRALKPGGLYIVEDMGTSFGNEVREVYGAPGGPDMFAVLLTYASHLVGHSFPNPVSLHLPTESMVRQVADMVDTITMVRGAVLIRKKNPPPG